MNELSRRDFIKSAALGAAALSINASSWARVIGANEAINVAQIGFHSQGAGHINTLSKMKGVRLMGLCDVDQDVLMKKKAELAKGDSPINVETYSDLRRLLDNKDVDAVSIAVPNHWHALATVWACQAGKDVYVEKPASHNLFEGRKMVEAARQYNRIVQVGTQCRSSVGIQTGVAYVQAGKLGKIKLARGFCYKSRPSIGLTGGTHMPPANIDYNLWLGPALYELPRRNGKNGPVHYDWHWFWAYGGGDYGNQGPHQVDIGRWFLGEEMIAPFTMSCGGRLGYVDDAETPNTLIVYHGYEKAPFIFEVRGLPHGAAGPAEGAESTRVVTSGTKTARVGKGNKGGKAPRPGRKARVASATTTETLVATAAASASGGQMDNYKGASVGNVIECEGGYVVVPDYSTAIVFDNEGKQIEKFTGQSGGPKTGLPGLSADSGGHHANWIKAIRSRKSEELHADILVGHISAGLVHTGNISYRLGAQANPDAIKEAMKGMPGMTEAFERMAKHLESNKVDITTSRVQLGAPLKVDPKAERFIDNTQADKLVTRPYRAPFIVPDKV